MVPYEHCQLHGFTIHCGFPSCFVLMKSLGSHINRSLRTLPTSRIYNSSWVSFLFCVHETAG
uniref:Uncharacterized protein n=1 Tax=Aegilops tauschii subsp. strangulata TaxID=200361 RepID=A0A452XYQ6_AEGTS